MSNLDLEFLSTNFCETFLRYRKEGQSVVVLYGETPDLLSAVKTRMDIYFNERGERVNVNTEKGAGYWIDVGLFLSFPRLNTSVR
jgi:hypothetical protein